jgi:glycosyltransferase 2 family protein
MSLATFGFAIVAIGIVIHALQEVTLTRVIGSLSRIGFAQASIAFLCVAGSYMSLTVFDWLGTRYAGGTLAYRRIALASFLSLSIGHTVGLAPFSSGAIRYRYYSRWGLTGEQIALVIVFSVITVTLGEVGLSAITLLTHPAIAQKLLGTSMLIPELIGILAAAIVFAYVGGVIFLRRPLTMFGRCFVFPDIRLAVAQLGIGLLNYIFVTGTLFVLLSTTGSIDFFTVVTAYMLANVTALISHVPGGLGVLEGTIFLLLPDANVLGPLIAFRCLYFLIPLGIGLATLGVTELLEKRSHPPDGASEALPKARAGEGTLRVKERRTH